MNTILAASPPATTITIGGVTLGSILALVGAIAGAIAAVFGYLNRKKMQAVHLTVNGNLKSAVDLLQTEVRRTTQLHTKLIESGIEVPERFDGQTDSDAARAIPKNPSEH